MRGRREDGIVAGGGVALLYAARALDGLEPASDDQPVGIDILRHALEQPVREIAHHAGIEGSVGVGKLRSAGCRYGFDAKMLRYGNLTRVGIVDPTKVVRLALKGPASVASLLITTEVIIQPAL